MLNVAPGASRWTADHIALTGAAPLPAAPVIPGDAGGRVLPGFDLWDFWPVQRADGSVAPIAGGSLWMALSAPALGDPVERHAVARIRLFHVTAEGWRDLGPLLPDGFGPGSREWSGSALLEGGGTAVRLFFTAAGRFGEARPSWEQRLVQTRATLDLSLDGPRLTGWTPPQPIVETDRDLYHPADQAEGAAGEVKALRDPGFFRDPADGATWIFFTASLGRSASRWNGCIGVARALDSSLDRWERRSPIVSADGLNNELERPHMLQAGGRYYLFWSTQRSVFAPDGPSGPTGLYGMVGPTPTGPFVPVNGSGLIIANPPEAPAQAYSWLVSADWSVSSFTDYPGPGPAPTGPIAARQRFGGGLAPTLHLAPEGTSVHLIA